MGGSRRLARALGAIGIAALLTGAGLLGTAGAGEPTRASDPPNVVVVMSDDQTYDSLARMPAVLGELAAEGTSYERFFASYPLCCPSRATFLTGQYFHNHHVEGTYRGLRDRDTLPVWLRRAGYRTGFVGKYLNKYGKDRPRYVPPGWSEWHAAEGASTQSVFRYALNEDGQLNAFGVDETDFKQDVFAGVATDFIERRAPGPPFFLYVAYTAPHIADPPRPFAPNCRAAAQPAPRHAHLFDDAPLPRPPSFNEANTSDKPDSKPGAVGSLPRLTPGDVNLITRRYRCALEALQSVDEGVEALVDELEASGELDNTLIAYTSDNGFFFGEHRVPSQKGRPYEEAIHVPLVLRGPGVDAGRSSRRLAVNPDLTSTILDAANVRPGLPADGVSLLGPGPSRRAIAIESASFEGVRTAGHKLVLNRGGGAELYDLRRDPFELRNVARVGRYAPVRRRLAERLDQLSRCHGATCR